MSETQSLEKLPKDSDAVAQFPEQGLACPRLCTSFTERVYTLANPASEARIMPKLPVCF